MSKTGVGAFADRSGSNKSNNRLNGNWIDFGVYQYQFGSGGAFSRTGIVALRIKSH